MAEQTVAQGRKFFVGFGVEGDAGVAAAPTVWPELTSESFSYDPSRQDFIGLSGSRSHHYQAVEDGNIVTAGGVVFPCRKEWLDDVLYWAMGGGNAAAPTLAETLPTVTSQVYKDLATEALDYLGCKITTLELTSESNGPLIATPTFVPMGVTTGVTPDAVTRTITDPFLMHHHLTLTVDGGTIYCSSIALTIDNAVEDGHFMNSQSRVAVPAGDRMITGTITCDWNAANATTRGIWTKFLSGATASIAPVYADGSNTLTMTMPRCVYPAGGPPQGDDRAMIQWEVPFEAKSSAAGVQDEFTAVWS